MKLLKNKSTGEIGCLVCLFEKTPEKITVVEYIDGRRGSKVWYYDTLAELNEKWEDYEELKEYWYIDTLSNEVTFNSTPIIKDIEDDKEIGNYFETKEEAEKAIEKLKAYKRLKDKGMIKYSFHKEKTGIDLDFYTLTILAPRDKDSLDLLFGEEE